MIQRRKTRTVDVGGVKIGSDYPVSIQSMTNTRTSDVSETVSQIRSLSDAGCEIVRVAVKDEEDARAISDIKKESSVPVVADIHFDHKLALASVSAGADKVRINPGNMKKEADVFAVVDACGEKGVPIRIGVNSGSLMEIATGKGVPSELMVSSVLGYIAKFESRGFKDIVVSLKSSDVTSTIEAYRLIAAECDYPLHVGVTAAGSPDMGIVKASIGIGALLVDGIGDTIRVSLTADPVKEVDAARRILTSSGRRSFGPEIIACPTCGRCQVDLEPMVKEVEAAIADVDKPLLVAVMGCEVNGPGEAMVADIGIAFGRGKGAIFKKGKILKTVDANIAIKELVGIINNEM